MNAFESQQRFYWQPTQYLLDHIERNLRKLGTTLHLCAYLLCINGRNRDQELNNCVKRSNFKKNKIDKKVYKQGDYMMTEFNKFYKLIITIKKKQENSSRISSEIREK